MSSIKFALSYTKSVKLRSMWPCFGHHGHQHHHCCCCWIHSLLSLALFFISSLRGLFFPTLRFSQWQNDFIIAFVPVRISKFVIFHLQTILAPHSCIFLCFCFCCRTVCTGYVCFTVAVTAICKLPTANKFFFSVRSECEKSLYLSRIL